MLLINSSIQSSTFLKIANIKSMIKDLLEETYIFLKLILKAKEKKMVMNSTKIMLSGQSLPILQKAISIAIRHFVKMTVIQVATTVKIVAINGTQVL